METPGFLKKIADSTRLMEGENRDNYDADDIAHWGSVYGDLVRFKEQLLVQTRDHIRNVPSTETELAGVDIPFLEAETARLRKGLAFWESVRARR